MLLYRSCRLREDIAGIKMAGIGYDKERKIVLIIPDVENFTGR